jgi:hypothetical protein
MNEFNNDEEMYNNEIDDLNDIKIDNDKFKINKYNEDEIVFDEKINYDEQNNIINDNNNINNNINNNNEAMELNKGLKSEKSNIVVNRNIIYNINNVVNINNQKSNLKKDKINLSKSPQSRPLLINKYENETVDKNNLNLLQLERRRLYGKNMNILGIKKRKIDDIYKHYIPMYGNNKLLNLNKYAINGKSNNEINKLPNIYNNKGLGNNYSNNIIINRRLKPLVNKNVQG